MSDTPRTIHDAQGARDAAGPGHGPRCPACDRPLAGDRARFVLDDPGRLTVFACPCGVHYTDYALAGRAADVYDQGYYAHPRYATDAGRRACGRHLARLLDRARLGVPAGRRLLDVGCATGDFVDDACRAGWDAEGIDISPEAVEIGRSQGRALRVGDVAGLASAGLTYDAITLWDVLEHLPDPRGALSALRTTLAEGGTLVLTTVTCTSLVDRLARTICRLTGGAVQGPMKRMYVPGHLYYFTRPTLCQTLSRAGWEPVALIAGDTPPAAVTTSVPLRLAMAALWAAQRVTGLTYELLAVCRPRPRRSE